MKRYIRISNGQIFDTSHLPSEYTVVDDELYYFFAGKLVGEGQKIVKSSDDIVEIINVGDLVKRKVIPGNHKLKPYIELTEIDSSDEVPNFKYEYYEIYTKQGPDYILMWNKRKGIRLK